MSTQISVRPDGVGVLTLNNAPVNSLASSLMESFKTNFSKLVADPKVKAIVVTGAGNFFCGGAEISEFAGLAAKGPDAFKGASPVEPLCAVFDMVDASPKTVVAAINGAALGGGLEVALACHHRVMSPKASVGFPEVQLGLLPGGEGTQRLPRVAPLEVALPMLLTGAPLKADKALKGGVVDAIAKGDVVEEAAQMALARPPAPISKRPVPADTRFKAMAGGLDQAAIAASNQAPGMIAPDAIINCVRAACSQLSFQEGVKVEGQEFTKLLMGDQSKALQHMFFAQRACSKVPGLTAKPVPLNTVGIIGSGLMGGGIAMCCAEAGMHVIVLDIDEKNLERGMGVIKKTYQRSVARKSKTQAKVDEFLSRIKPSSSYDSLGTCDLVIEAVFENMALKKKIFAQLDQVCKPGCILSSNTSALNIDEIASATKRPQDVVGCHFFSPANVMPLLENVRGPRTGPVAIATAMSLGQKIKKITCLVGNCDGFIANRVMGQSGAVQLMNSGLMPQQVDAASEAYGMRMGPARMSDLVGLDLFGRERAETGKAEPDKMVTDAMYAAKRFGQKNGKGFYKYDDKLQLSRDPEAEEMIKTVWKNRGVVPTAMSQEDIIDALYLPVVNEGFKCLEEGMAQRPSDIDICMVFGYGWPAYTGGPMQWATAVGLPRVLAKLEKIGVKPSALLQECVKNGWDLKSKEFGKRIEQAWSGAWSKL